jgi:cytochrome c oxidase subunit 2
VLGILYLIFRIGNLVGLVKGKEVETDDSSWNTINAYLLLFFMIGGLGCFLLVFICSF